MSDIKARRRTKDIALPRQIAMYLTKQVTHSSLSEIGKQFGGKDHATVIYACKQIEERKNKDGYFVHEFTLVDSWAENIREYIDAAILEDFRLIDPIDFSTPIFTPFIPVYITPVLPEVIGRARCPPY